MKSELYFAKCQYGLDVEAERLSEKITLLNRKLFFAEFILDRDPASAGSVSIFEAMRVFD